MDVPAAGRICIIHPKIKRHLVGYLIDKGYNFGGSAQRAAMEDYILRDVFGLNFRIDTSIPTAGLYQYHCHFIGGGGDAGVVIKQIQEVEALQA